MSIRGPFFLVIATCLIVLGCQSDSEGGKAHAAHAEDGPPSTEPGMTTVTGKLSGFDCAVVGQLCPSTHRGGDYTTGVFTDDGSFYFVVNIPNSFLTQHFLKTVEVDGKVYGPYAHAVEPEAIRLLEDGDQRLVYEEGYFITEGNQRATFHEGQFRNGRWIVPE